MRILFFCLLIVNFLQARGQTLQWHEGAVVLSSEKVLRGKISFTPLQDVLLFQETGDLARVVLPAHKVRSLYYYDRSADINRRFMSLRVGDTFYPHYAFFEVVIQGTVYVVRRQRMKGAHPSDALDFDYNVLYENELIPLRKFDKKVYPRLQNQDQHGMNSFVSKNKLNPTVMVDVIRIIEFYNQRSGGDMLAKH